jgi:hypothetical protein
MNLISRLTALFKRRASAEPTEMWTFAVRIPPGSAEQVHKAIEATGAEVYRSWRP